LITKSLAIKLLTKYTNMKRNNLILLANAVLLVLTMLNACKGDDDSAKNTDQELLDLSKSATGFTWYKNSDALLPKSSGTGHSQPLLRTRYNDVAAAMLDMDGKVKAGTVFPDGSLIVKELNNNATTIGRYAILYKQSGHADADADGWVWGYINANGSVAEPAANKGNGCRGCHGQADHIDFTLMNKFFQ
jgi:Cytochrome P460